MLSEDREKCDALQACQSSISIIPVPLCCLWHIHACLCYDFLLSNHSILLGWVWAWQSQIQRWASSRY